MRFFGRLASGLALTATWVAAAPTDSATVDLANPSTMEDFQALAMENLRAAEAEGVQGRSENSCTLANARVRRDWEHFSTCEKKDYIRAVKCLWELPSRGPPEFSAAQNHFDDFVAIHINLTDFIHGTGNFLTWHRYLIHIWEENLRNDCGYKGTLPYWNWFKYQDNLSASPVFDGSETSMGGDGEYFPHNGSLVGAGQVWLPPGKGGGCVKSGPFKDYQINLGPIRPAMNDYLPLMPNQLHYNPRCQRRGLTEAASAYFTLENLAEILIGEHSQTIGAFQDELQGPYGTLRMHGAGHYAMGGDGSDVFSSLNDPAFYHHHAMVDRVYWIWQALHPREANTINGTRTFRNIIPSGNATVDDPLDVGVLGPHLPIKDMFNTLSGSPLCYIYL